MRQRFADRDAGGRGLQTFDLRTTIHAVTALECALLDLLGQFLGRAGRGAAGRRPAARCRWRCWAISSTSATARKTNLPYRSDPEADDDWLRLRHEEALTPDAIVRLAEAAHARYGFNDFKLKGGVLAGAQEMEAVDGAGQALSRRRASRSTPTAPGRSRKPSRCAAASSDVLAYAEDPVRRREPAIPGARSWRSSAAPPALPTATNMIATDWRQMVPRHPAAVGGHSAGRSAFLDHAGLGAGGADVPRLAV